MFLWRTDENYPSIIIKTHLICSSVIRVYTVCHSVYIFWMHYSYGKTTLYKFLNKVFWVSEFFPFLKLSFRQILKKIFSCPSLRYALRLCSYLNRFAWRVKPKNANHTGYKVYLTFIESVHEEWWFMHHCLHSIIWALSWENLSLGFSTR